MSQGHEVRPAGEEAAFGLVGAGSVDADQGVAQRGEDLATLGRSHAFV
ncbi:hypothetical protein [Streptomyces sp. NPDC057552]